ncbi:MAG: hypothetical protein KF691_14825 [Phycisphaeraceae bacterium]|nr:hypothetical protein [Phycisphaeraceae bacterium]
MTTLSALRSVLVCTIAFSAGPAFGQHDHHSPSSTDESKQHGAPAADAPASQSNNRIGDPYPLGMCPVSGKKFGAMGDADIKVYEGHEVRFCCSKCPPKFEKDLPASTAKLDAKIAEDQRPLYPLTTSVVTGKDLPAKPYEFVFGNRLIRLGAESEKEMFFQNPKKYLAEIDAAAIKAQTDTYPLTKCPVSDEDLGGAMGEADSIVVGGRMIQICCADCKSGIEKDPAKYLNMVDQARKSKSVDSEAGNDKKNSHGEHMHGDN